MNSSDIHTLASVHKYHRGTDAIIVTKEFADELREVPEWERSFRFTVGTADNTVRVRISEQYSIPHVVKQERPSWDGGGHWWEYLPPPPKRQWRADGAR